MERPLSTLGGLVLIVIAGAQAWRAYNGFDVSVGDFHVPIIASWIASGVTGILGLGTLAGR
jgi:hypothetical protein